MIAYQCYCVFLLRCICSLQISPQVVIRVMFMVMMSSEVILGVFHIRSRLGLAKLGCSLSTTLILTGVSRESFVELGYISFA